VIARRSLKAEEKGTNTSGRTFVFNMASEKDAPSFAAPV
jgi:hypothetical protein